MNCTKVESGTRLFRENTLITTTKRIIIHMEDKNKLAFGRQNYTLMLAGIAVLIIGFIIMSMDKETFGFGALGLTVGPIIVMIGFIIEFFAILRKPSK